MTDMELATAQKPTILDHVRWKIGSAKHRFVTSWRRGCDWLKWIGHKEGNIERHARHELELAGWLKEDGFYGDMMGRAVMNLCRAFSEEGHSGMSAGLAVNLFKDVSMFKPLIPLTGEDDEWNEVGEGVWQNKRCSHVFKEMDVDGPRAYDIDGKVFKEPSGATYTSRDSRVYIKFPYTPKTQIVYVPASGPSADDINQTNRAAVHAEEQKQTP